MKPQFAVILERIGNEMNIEELKQEINNQREENIRLYEIFQYRLHEENMQPLVCTWRDGSKKLKELLNQLWELEKEEKKNKTSDVISKKYVNGYGEATGREITSSTYIRADRRLSKEIMSFVGG